MSNPIPDAKRVLLDKVAAALSDVPGVVAIGLGGSHARGTHHAGSDLDIGIYYRERMPFAIDTIRSLAGRFSPDSAPTVTGFNEWGPFVNGGAWIENPVCKIDFLYRNLDQLQREIDNAERGETEHSFDQQPPFGFRTVTTLGEIDCCLPLHDPENAVADLKARVRVFPPRLRKALITNMLWGAEFSFIFAEGFARDGDVPNTAGCMTRIFHYLVHVLFALNETYLVNDKRVLPIIEGFKLRPQDFAARMSDLLGRPGRTREELGASLARLRALFDETVALTGGTYQPKFRVPSA